MSQFRIQGEAELSGEIKVAGAKNHILKMIPAALLCDGPVTFTNVPAISDVDVMLEIFEHLGGTYERNGDTITLQSDAPTCSDIPSDLSRKVRSGLLFVAPLLASCGEAVFGHTGGDSIGKRPTDLFDEGYQALGATIKEMPDSVVYTLSKRNDRVRYVLPWISHTVTEAMILSAVKGSGEVRIVNAATEPEVVSMCEFFVACGATIDGIGTSTITIKGVKSLQGVEWKIIPDRIELATFAVMGALNGVDLTITHGEPRHLEVFWRALERMHVPFQIDDTTVRVQRAEKMMASPFRTHEYPGLATDYQPPLTVLATQAHGNTLVHETVYEGRLFYTDALVKMGADITLCDPHRALVTGPSPLFARSIDSPDIRAGMALLLAALRAKGESVIDNIHHIDRGYERIEERLNAIGACIMRELQTEE